MALIGNVSGSLTKTAAGKSYIRQGSGITITSGSTESNEHFITISASSGGSVAADDIASGDDAINLQTSSGNVLVDSQAGTTTIDGHTGVTVQSTNSGDITLDSVADVVLDADGDQVTLKFGGNTGQLDFSNTNSGDITIQQKTDGKIISFLDHDGSANFNILDAGAGISVIRDSASIKFGENEDIILTHDPDRGLILEQPTDATGEPVFTVKTVGDLASGGGIEFISDNGAGEGDGDVLGFLSFKGDDSGDNATQYAKLSVLSSDVTDGDEGGQFKFEVMANDGASGNHALTEAFNIIGGLSSAAEVVVNDGGEAISFRVESNNSTHMLHVDQDDMIGIGIDANSMPVNNAYMFVSGAKSATNAQDTDNDEGVHFGGDVVVSGSMFGNVVNAKLGFGTDQSIQLGQNVVVGGAVQHQGNTDTQIAFDTDKMTLSAGGVEMITLTEADNDSVVVNGAGTAADLDFRVASSGKSHAIFVDGGNDFVEIGAAGEAFTSQDVNVHLSGTVGSNESPDNAILVSGDLVVSGAIFGGGAEGITGRELTLSSQVISVGNSRGEEFGEDVSFFVSGSKAVPNSAEQKTHIGVALFGGSVVLSGSVLPGLDNAINLGASTNRFANIFTADLNLRNERGDWTLIEEEEFISFRNNATGKRYKMLMQEITGDGSYGPGNDGEM